MRREQRVLRPERVRRRRRGSPPGRGRSRWRREGGPGGTASPCARRSTGTARAGAAARELVVEAGRVDRRASGRRGDVRGRRPVGSDRVAPLGRSRRHAGRLLSSGLRVCRDLPASARCASPMASDRDGWGWIIAATSAGTASQFTISMPSAMRSVTCGPIMWTPRTGPPPACATSFTMPPSPRMFALPIACMFELLDLDLVASLGRLGLGEADARDLGRAVRHAAHARIVDLRRVEAGDAFGHGDPLGERHVRQLVRGRRDVAHRPHVRHGRLRAGRRPSRSPGRARCRPPGSRPRRRSARGPRRPGRCRR